MKPINEQFKPEFLVQARKLAYFTQLLHGILPVECRGHVTVANVRNQNLMLITDSPVWTTRLRQLSPQILQFIRKNTANNSNNKEQIHHVQISTRYQASSPDQQQAKKKDKPDLQISDKTSSMLLQSADSIQHQQLKASLLRLARHSRSNRSDEE
jgi:hypothetical protein